MCGLCSELLTGWVCAGVRQIEHTALCWTAAFNPWPGLATSSLRRCYHRAGQTEIFFFSPRRAKQTGGQTARRKSLCSNTPPLHKQAARFLGTHLCSPGMFYCGLTPRASRKQPEVIYVPSTLKTGAPGSWERRQASTRSVELEAVQSSLCKWAVTMLKRQPTADQDFYCFSHGKKGSSQTLVPLQPRRRLLQQNAASNWSARRQRCRFWCESISSLAMRAVLHVSELIMSVFCSFAVSMGATCRALMEALCYSQNSPPHLYG